MLSTKPISFGVLRDPLQREAIGEAVQAMLDKHAIEVVENTSSPGFYSRIFLVPKRGGGIRPVIDLSVLNGYLIRETFKMETPATISASLRRGEYTTSIDLKDAYFHIPMARSSRKFLRFEALG